MIWSRIYIGLVIPYPTWNIFCCFFISVFLKYLAFTLIFFYLIVSRRKLHVNFYMEITQQKLRSNFTRIPPSSLTFDLRLQVFISQLMISRSLINATSPAETMNMQPIGDLKGEGEWRNRRDGGARPEEDRSGEEEKGGMIKKGKGRRMER